MLKKTAKEFALQAQRRLIADVKLNASRLGINPSGISESSSSTESPYAVKERREDLRRHLISAIRQLEAQSGSYLTAYKKVLSEAAYSCFISLIALRFLEANDFLPQGERPLLQCEEPSDEEFTKLFVNKCQSLAKCFPTIFAEVPDYLELLLSLSHEDEDGVLRHLLHDIPEADFDLRQRGQVEILGWFYQYYTEERRDEIISLNVKQIEKADIPTATQVFTPDWIVRYLLENSLGRFWLERNPESALRGKMDFFAEPKSGSDLNQRDHIAEQLQPQDLTVLDPCVGSGHILLYAFDLLIEIYGECGYTKAEAAREIVRHNLHGIDIDERVVKLAKFALSMKARSYDPEFFDSGIEVQIFALEESNGLDSAWPASVQNIDPLIAECGAYLLTVFREAGEIGSLLHVEARDYKALIDKLDDLAADLDPELQENLNWLQQCYPLVKTLAQQALLLSRKYSVVCTNPPYMNRFTGLQKAFVRKNYFDYRRDLFSVYIYRNFLFCRPGGYSALMTPYVWMFIKSYEKLRRFIIKEKAITTLVQLEYSAFDAATVPVCAFVLKNAPAKEKGLYIKLSEFAGGLRVQERKLRQALTADSCSYFYESDVKNFHKLPGTPIAYWATEQVFAIFEQGTPMKDLLEARQGLASGDNNRFLRLWFEVEVDKINFDASSVEDFHRSGKLYAPLNKGGRYRRWYGNYDYVIKFDPEYFEILAGLGNRLPSRQFYFRESISWSLITSAGFSIRYRKSGSVPNVAGNSAFSADTDLLKYLLALLSTPIADYLFKMLNPTLNLNVGDFDNFPVYVAEECKEEALKLAEDCVALARSDWDSFEVSREFSCHPLADFTTFREHYLSNLRSDQEEPAAPHSLAEAYELLKDLFGRHFYQLKRKEAEVNRLFIDLYGLEEELDAVPNDKDISSSLIFDLESDIPAQMQGNRYVLCKADVLKQFISYAVGCIFGRYSLDETGLIYAGGAWDAKKYQSFKPSQDNIVTLSDEDYFEDDLVNRFSAFVEEIYGSASLEENLNFIAAGLAQKPLAETEDPRAVIRAYFLKDFYQDHCKTYSVSGSGKRPIYWLYDSGKENGFKAFIYMHRYKKGTNELLRSKYLKRQIKRYRDELADLEALSAEGLCTISPAERKQRQAKLQRQLRECQTYDKNLEAVAALRIDLNADDGVLTNYRKLQTLDGQVPGILAPIS
ncbi:MAG: BREX-1 system adenine-specific DNA-methyltransferase PglX [Eubacteriales bacterium]|nr:BREX-1 system adenine-specific DNA-methyltransferase PglX [Eubacteriales bacterium]